MPFYDGWGLWIKRSIRRFRTRKLIAHRETWLGPYAWGILTLLCGLTPIAAGMWKDYYSGAVASNPSLRASLAPPTESYLFWGLVIGGAVGIVLRFIDDIRKQRASFSVANRAGSRLHQLRNCVAMTSLEYEKLQGESMGAGVANTNVLLENAVMHALGHLWAVFATVIFTDPEKGAEHLKVVGAVVRDGQIVDVTRYKQPARTASASTAQQLNEEGTTFRQCIKDRDLVIVEDIREEIRLPGGSCRFKVTAGRPTLKDGSLLCYPVVSEATGAVLMVISVFCGKGGMILERNKGYYKSEIEPYAACIAQAYAAVGMIQGASG
ncbi:MAG: hypothetical protein QOJ64_2495, partial [Acidobacteriota bacterium]|jgi:hypothetical protein|nr:hypothetical protein [Acidobacteriota bacterium]